MDVIEFVREYGLDTTKKVVYRDTAPYAKAVCVYNGKLTFSVSVGGPEWVLISDLKQIVKAFDCVMEHGSVEHAKKYAESDYTAPEVKDFLLKAINLVEQCKND